MSTPDPPPATLEVLEVWRGDEGAVVKDGATTEHNPPLLSTPELRARGWTTALITRFLGEPDSLRPNPRYRRAAPMRLYARSRVEQIEADPAFAAAKERAGLRSQRAKAVATHKAEELKDQAQRIPIRVALLPPDQLLRRAIAAYNEWHAVRSVERGYDYDSASEASDAGFLARITVNFVRHRLTAYDRRLAGAAGKIGVQAAVAIIRGRVYAAIAEAYPHLAAECQRQLAERHSRIPGVAASEAGAPEAPDGPLLPLDAGPPAALSQNDQASFS